MRHRSSIAAIPTTGWADSYWKEETPARGWPAGVCSSVWLLVRASRPDSKGYATASVGQWSNLSQHRLICVKPAVAIGRTLATMAGIDWIYVLSVGTLALSIGAMCILLFAI